MLPLTPQALQTLVLGLHMMKMEVRKMFQIHPSLSLHIHPTVSNFHAYVSHIFFIPWPFIKKQSKEKEFDCC